MFIIITFEESVFKIGKSSIFVLHQHLQQVQNLQLNNSSMVIKNLIKLSSLPSIDLVRETKTSKRRFERKVRTQCRMNTLIYLNTSTTITNYNYHHLRQLLSHHFRNLFLFNVLIFHNQHLG